MQHARNTSVLILACCLASCQRQEAGLVEVHHEKSLSVAAFPGYDAWYKSDSKKAGDSDETDPSFVSPKYQDGDDENRNVEKGNGDYGEEGD